MARAELAQQVVLREAIGLLGAATQEVAFVGPLMKLLGDYQLEVLELLLWFMEMMMD